MKYSDLVFSCKPTIYHVQGDLWFGNEDLMTPDGTAKFDRMGHLKTTLFTLLCDENYKIEYTDFLLLFSSDPEPGNGKPRFYLSVSLDCSLDCSLDWGGGLQPKENRTLPQI